MFEQVNTPLIHMQLLSDGTECYETYFPSFSNFVSYFTSVQVSEIVATYEKRGNYLPILYEAKCDNYFTIKCLFKSSVAKVCNNANLVRIIRCKKLTLPGYISKHLTVLFPYFNLSISYSVHLFGIQWPFAIDLFSNVLFQTFDYF